MKAKAPKKKPVKVKKEPPPPEPVVQENFSWFFLSALYGAILYKLYLTHYVATVPFNSYLNLYVAGWLLSLGIGLVSLLVLRTVRVLFYSKTSSFYACLGFLNLSFLLYILQPAQWANPGRIAYFLMLQLLGAVLAKITDLMGSLSFRNNLFYFFSIAAGAAWFTKVCPGWYGTAGWGVFNFVFFALILLCLMLGVQREPGLASSGAVDWRALGGEGRGWFWGYGLAFLMIGFSINTLFNYEPFHYSYYLGPLADMAAGKSLLVNINAQYGVMVFYFLRFFFLFMPICNVSFSFILAVLTLTQYLLFYYAVSRLFKSQRWSFFSLAVLLLINHFSQENGGILFPSVGPLRFGFIYVLAALVISRGEFPKKRNLFLALETAVVGIAFFWSVEVCVYVVVSYLCLALYESIDFDAWSKFKFAYLTARLAGLAGWILVLAGILYADVFRRVHAWPDWPFYFGYITNYKNGLNMVQLPGMDYWWLVVGIYYFSLFAILGISLNRSRPQPIHLNAILLVNLYGILQLTYYFSRANWNNLLHVSMPGVLLGLYWLNFLRRYDPPSVPDSVKKLGYALAVLVAGFFLQKTTGPTLVKIKAQPTSPLVMVDRILHVLPTQMHSVDPNVLQIVSTIKKYSGDSKSVVYFLGEAGYSVCMASGIANRYPYSDTDQPLYSPPAMDHINSFDPQLKIGDYIYTNSPGGFEKKLFDKLAARLRLDLVEQANGLSVYKVAGPQGAS